MRVFPSNFDHGTQDDVQDETIESKIGSISTGSTGSIISSVTFAEVWKLKLYFPNMAT